MKYRTQLIGLNKTLFVSGVTLALTIGLFLLSVFLLDRSFFLKLSGTIVASVAGGRSTAILAGLEFRLHPLIISTLVFSINLAWLCTMLPLLITFYHHLVEVKYVGKMLESTKERAQSQKTKVALWGSWALPFFIWLPFPFTGSFAGAVIGFLLGIPMTRLLIIVISSMLVGIVSWTYGFDYFFFLTGTTGKIITYVIIAGFIIRTFIQNRHHFKEQKPEKPGTLKEQKPDSI